MKLIVATLALLLSLTDAQAPPRPLNIVLTNDDGFETNLIQGLFDQLVLAGHNVVMSAPYTQQSGTSGLIDFLRPIVSTTAASAKGTIAAGSPGVGPTTIKPNQFYVNGAVTGAALYGIDVVAPSVFGGPGRVDLVISGPNEGQNVGLLGPHSGTIGAAVTALNRGIPAIACSADSTEPNTPLIGQLMVKLINSIPRNPTTGGLSFLGSVGLNVNFPRLDPLTSINDYFFFGTQTGIATNSVGLQFVANLNTSCAAVLGRSAALPGLCVAGPYTAAGYPLDSNPLSEGNLISDGQRSIAVSVIEGTYQADFGITQTIHNVLNFNALNGGNACRSTFNYYNGTSNLRLGSLNNGGTINNPPCSIGIEIVPGCNVAGPVVITTLQNGNVINTRNENIPPYFAFGDNGAGDVFGTNLAVPASYELQYTVNGIPRSPFRFRLAGTCRP